jgi:hypothetical protein
MTWKFGKVSLNFAQFPSLSLEMVSTKGSKFSKRESTVLQQVNIPCQNLQSLQIHPSWRRKRRYLRTRLLLRRGQHLALDWGSWVPTAAVPPAASPWVGQGEVAAVCFFSGEERGSGCSPHAPAAAEWQSVRVKV